VSISGTAFGLVKGDGRALGELLVGHDKSQVSVRSIPAVWDFFGVGEDLFAKCGEVFQRWFAMNFGQSFEGEVRFF